MNNHKKETVAEALSDTFGGSPYYASYRNAQKLYNKRESDLADYVASGGSLSYEETPISLGKKLWGFLKYPFEFRLVHKDDIHGEDY